MSSNSLFRNRREIMNINDFLDNDDEEFDSNEAELNFFNKREMSNANMYSDNDQLPCEFCNKLFDFDQLISHQVIENLIY
jgi:hypothetical protein